MRLLTVPQPAASVLSAPGLHGRPVINRRFAATYTGPVVLVAGYVNRSQMGDPMVRSTLVDSGVSPDALPTEAAVATAIVVDCHRADGACCAPWGYTNASWFHLVLDDVRALREPVRLPLRPGLTALTEQERASVLVHQ